MLDSSFFSEKIIRRYQHYMRKRCGVFVSEEEAKIELASLIDFYSLFKTNTNK
jgi:hypothetical protein